jgi:hypothetical protein
VREAPGLQSWAGERTHAERHDFADSRPTFRTSKRASFAYQFSPDGEPRGVLPARALPVHRQRQLEWRVSTGRGTVTRPTVVYPAEGAPFNVALVDCD